MEEARVRISKNNEYYNLFLEKVKERTENRDYSYLLSRFVEILPEQACVLDIGCGTGEHLTYFKQRKVEAYGIDPSSKMREYCEKCDLSVLDGTFESLNHCVKAINSSIGGIWCASSLLHVPLVDFQKIELIDFFFKT